MHTVRRTSKASRALGSEKKEKWHEKDLGGEKKRNRVRGAGEGERGPSVVSVTAG